MAERKIAAIGACDCEPGVKSKCKEAGALGGGISGSGPSIFMLSKDKATAEKVEKVMKEIYDNIGLPYYTYVTTINKNGVTIID